jgi:hypothetical protein
MAEEVTKKDLQSLQGYCNKQIADVTKRIEKAESSIKKAEGAIEALNEVPTKEDVGLAELLKARCDKLELRCAELSVKIAALEKR